MSFVRYAGTRDAYGATLAQLGREDPRIVVLTADLGGSTKTSLFAKEHPERFFNMGVAEPDMMGVAAGLAMSGYRPFASTFAVFATGKAWEQVRQVIAYPKSTIPELINPCVITKTATTVITAGFAKPIKTSSNEIILKRAITNRAKRATISYRQRFHIKRIRVIVNTIKTIIT